MTEQVSIEKGRLAFLERCKQHDYEILSEYIKGSVRVLVRCPKGHEQSVMPCDFKASPVSCRHCKGLTKQSGKQTFELVCKERGFTILSPYINTDTHVSLQCAEGHEWRSRPCNIKSGYGCPVCSGTCPVATKERFTLICSEKGFEFCDEAYINTRTPLRLTCSKGHTWHPRPNGILQGSGCPGCARSGYKTRIKGTFYLYRWFTEGDSFLKVGITNNKDTRKRIANQQIGTSYAPEHVLSHWFTDGLVPVKIERKIKTTLKTGIISPELFRDGHTETLEDTQENIDFITALVEQFIEKETICE